MNIGGDLCSIMIITYANAQIRKLCCDPDKYGRKEGLPRHIIEELKIALTVIENLNNCEEFITKKIYSGYAFERLTNKNGLMSIRLNNKYRLEFIDIDNNRKKPFIQIVGIEIIQVSNHYGD